MKNEIQNNNIHRNLHSGIEDIKNLSMTSAEKERILHGVLSSPLPAGPIKSPWAVFSFFAAFKNNKFAFYGTASLIVLVLLSTSIVYASNGALPGNILYPVKVDIVEPIHSALTFSLQAKAEYQSSLATERLKEAETLANEGKLDAPTEAKLNTLLVDHTNALHKTLNELHQSNNKNDTNNPSDNSKNNNDDQNATIVKNFQAQMDAHAAILDGIRSRHGNGESSDDDNAEISNIAQTARDNGSSNDQNNDQQNTDDSNRGDTHQDQKSKDFFNFGGKDNKNN